MSFKLHCSASALPFLLMTMALSGAASAQEAPSAEAGATGLDTIVVTAQRRGESSQRAAIALDVATPAELARAGATTPTGLNAVAPSLFIARGGGANTSFFIRGVGNFTTNSYSDPAVAFNLDGVYLGRPTSTTGTFYDLQRVEVLKGPQGTLYGRNATGGAVNVITQAPILGELSGYASAGYGNYDALELEGALNVPLGDTVALRVAGRVANQDGFNEDGTDDNQGEAIRLQLLAEPSDWFSVRLIGDYSHTGGTGPGPQYLGTLRFVPGTPASALAPANYVYTAPPTTIGERDGFHTPAAIAYHSTFVIGGSFIRPDALQYPSVDGENYGISAEFNFDLGGGINFVFLPAYREFKLDHLFNGPAFKAGVNIEDIDQFSMEARLSGSTGPVDWLLGAYHYEETINSETAYNQYLVLSQQNYSTGTDSNAVFSRLTFNVSDTFRLVGAARYTQDEKFIEGLVTTFIQLCTTPPPSGAGCFGGPSIPTATSPAALAAAIPAALLPAGLPTAPGPANARPFGSAGNILLFSPLALGRELKDNRITYRLAAEYDVGPASLLYASYETGYHSGGFSASLGHETYAPEYISALTVGSKNRFLDNRLQVNLEAFYWRYRDQQVAHFGVDSNGGNSYYTENIGRSTIQGADVDIQFRATPTTTLTGSVQYLDSKLNDFIYTAPRGGTALPPVVGCPYTNGTAGANLVYLIDCSGNSGFNSPKWSLNGGIEQIIELGEYDLTFNGSARYRGNRVTGFDYLAQHNSGSDVTLDASLTFGPRDESWSITAWVRNLTDNLVPTTVYYFGSPGNVLSGSYLPPRTFGARVRYDF